jgi:glycine/D-amino acid oxidase-like deaminating enzyme
VSAADATTDRSADATTRAAEALAAARRAVYWTDRPDAPSRGPALMTDVAADMAIIGGGFTGLWAALLAREAEPEATIVVLEADAVGAGASGRNGGFVAASITHGLPHGVRTWPREIEVLQRLGVENLRAIVDFAEAHAIDADLRLCGKTTVATRPHEVARLTEQASL